MEAPNLDILYEDNHLFILRKPANLLVHGDKSGDKSLYEMGREYIKVVYNKPGNVYLGMVHRLDRPVSGVIAFTKTSKAAARVAKQFQSKTTQKRYWAIVEGKVPESGTLKDYMDRREATSFITSEKKGKYAELSYKRLGFANNRSWVEVDLKTGRHHQIRLQFSHIGHPIIGDFRYGSKIKFPKKSIALHAYYLELIHPTKQEPIIVTAEPESYWPAEFQL